MHHFVTEMCTHVHISVKRMVHFGIWLWRIVGSVQQICVFKHLFISFTTWPHPKKPTSYICCILRRRDRDNGPVRRVCLIHYVIMSIWYPMLRSSRDLGGRYTTCVRESTTASSYARQLHYVGRYSNLSYLVQGIRFLRFTWLDNKLWCAIAKSSSQTTKTKKDTFLQ